MTITDTTILTDAQGHEWTIAEWAEHAAEHGITWHIRLDGLAVVEGEEWQGGETLLEPATRRTAAEIAAILNTDTDGSILAESWGWDEVDQVRTGESNERVVLTTGEVIEVQARKWVVV